MGTRSVRLSVILLASLLVAGMLLLAACGGNSTKEAANPATTQVTGEPKTGGTLRVAIMPQGGNIGWPVGLTAGGSFAQSYYETLIRSDEKGKLYPWLAESWTVAPDHKSITFNIRKGVKFSDGSDLTADVVKWNLEQFKKQQPTWTSVDLVGTNAVKVSFKSWDSSILASFGDAQPGLYMVSKAAFDKVGQKGMLSKPVGTGPFVLTSYTMDGSAKMVKNPTYWAKDAKGNQLPYLDGMDWTFTADNTTELMMAKSGEVDMIINTFSGKQLTDYKNMGWRTKFFYDANEVWVPDSAHADSPWSKLEVREAAEYAIDRETIAKNFGYGFLEAPYQVPPRGTTAYQKDYPLARKYDPAKAKELLTQAGYPNGFKTTLIVWQGGSKDIALADQQYLAAVGIQATVQFADLGKWTSYIGPTGRYNNAILEGPDPSQGVTGLGCASFATFLYGSNWQQPAEFKQALAAANAGYPTASPTQVRAATDVLTKNALIIPLYEVGSQRVDQSYVVAHFGDRGYPAFCSFETAWINK